MEMVVRYKQNCVTFFKSINFILVKNKPINLIILPFKCRKSVCRTNVGKLLNIGNLYAIFLRKILYFTL